MGTSEELSTIREELENCRRALAGESVNGVKLGDAGITREWLEQTIRNLQSLLPAEQVNYEQRKYGIYDTRLMPPL